jgi:hypothetical protein
MVGLTVFFSKSKENHKKKVFHGNFLATWSFQQLFPIVSKNHDQHFGEIFKNGFETSFGKIVRKFSASLSKNF